MAGRVAAVLALGLPYLVMEDAGRILGFSYASSFRPRAAYRYTAEESVYIHPDFLGQGLGKALVSEVIAACEALGLRQLRGGNRRSRPTPAPSGLHRLRWASPRSAASAAL